MAWPGCQVDLGTSLPLEIENVGAGRKQQCSGQSVGDRGRESTWWGNCAAGGVHHS